EIAYFLRRLPNPQELADGLEHAAKLEDFIASLNSEIDQLEAKRRKLDDEIAKLEKEKGAKFNEVGSIVPEETGQAGTIIEAANSKAAELIKNATERAVKREAEADAYVKQKMQIVENWRRELT